MTESTRAPAPFLAPEIISNILGFVYTEHKESWRLYPVHRELTSLARISSGWTDEVQRQLFKGVTIKKSITLLKLVLALESTPLLGHFILSLKLIRLEPTHPVDDAHLVFQLLSSIPNLTYFAFVNPSFNSFSQEDSTTMQQAPLLLPKLTTLYLDAGRDKFWKREVFDFIVGAAGENLQELEITATSDYEGPMWNSSLPAKLKKLSTGPPLAVLEGKLFPVAQFRGLDSLEFNGEVENNQDSVLLFFEIVGPTLVDLNCRNLPAEVYPFLPVLERVGLSNLPLDDSIPPKLLLPSTLTFLEISGWGVDDEQPTPPITAWSHLTLLEDLLLVNLCRSFDLNELPPLKRITIDNCQEEVLLESMENLLAGQLTIGQLDLLDVYDVDEELEILEDYDGEEIRKRCEELEIEYILVIKNHDDW